jgi:dihydrofolate reductase
VRRIRYWVAMSVDGFIAAPNGEYDWIVKDPEIDFGAAFKEFDTALLGRRTFELVMQHGGTNTMLGMKVYVFSRTLRHEDYPDVTMVADKAKKTMTALKKEAGKDIWLMGGGELFRSLLSVGVVDRVEVKVIPLLLGGGIPLLPCPAKQAGLKLTGHRLYKKTGIMSLEYAVKHG